MQTLDEFMSQEKLRLQRFANCWLAQHAADSDKFPTRMEESDWDEALMTFSE